jgi:glycosyltransferase involved in cell wall biosynthesis
MDNKNELVSIVMATYNGEKYLQQQLDSIFQQTYDNIEIIAVDDASTDNTLNILNTYSLKHNNMKVFSNETNIGYIKNFEKGFMLSSGSFIAPSDQDDVWHTNKIKLLVEAINDCSLVYCDSFICNENLETNGEKISDKAQFSNFNSCLQQAIFSRIYGHTILFKRELLKKIIPFTEIIPHDWWIIFNAVLKGHVKYIAEPLVYYRQHDMNAVGVIGRKEKPKTHVKIKDKNVYNYKTRMRIKVFYEACPETMPKEKQVLRQLQESYKDFSFKNNLKRMILFFKHKDVFLATKRYSLLHKNLFCLKMFLKIK